MKRPKRAAHLLNGLKPEWAEIYIMRCEVFESDPPDWWTQKAGDPVTFRTRLQRSHEHPPNRAFWLDSMSWEKNILVTSSLFSQLQLVWDDAVVRDEVQSVDGWQGRRKQTTVNGAFCKDFLWAYLKAHG